MEKRKKVETPPHRLKRMLDGKRSFNASPRYSNDFSSPNESKAENSNAQRLIPSDPDHDNDENIL